MKVNLNSNNFSCGNLLLSNGGISGEINQEFNFLQVILLYLLSNGDSSSQLLSSQGINADQVQGLIQTKGTQTEGLSQTKILSKDQAHDEDLQGVWGFLFWGYLVDKTGINLEGFAQSISKEGLTEVSGLTLNQKALGELLDKFLGNPSEKLRVYEELNKLLSLPDLKSDFLAWLNHKIETGFQLNEDMTSLWAYSFFKIKGDLSVGDGEQKLKQEQNFQTVLEEKDGLSFQNLIQKLEEKIKTEVFSDKNFLGLKLKLLGLVKQGETNLKESFLTNNQVFDSLFDKLGERLPEKETILGERIAGVKDLRLTEAPFAVVKGLSAKSFSSQEVSDKSAEVFEKYFERVKEKGSFLAEGIALLKEKQGFSQEGQGELTRFQFFYHQVSHLRSNDQHLVNIETVKFLEGDKMSPQFFEFVKRFSAEVLPEGEKKAYVRLEPPHLGGLDLEIKVKEKEVIIVARVEKEEAFRELQNNVEAIRESLKELGLSLKDFQTQLNWGYQGFAGRSGEKREGSNGLKSSLAEQNQDPNVLDSNEGFKNLKGKHYFIV
ncbi:flagellar hook-length control protein FliK [Thermodesulfobacterium hveragerdense]|uniref:flagellar hook-length control protein FliK n=1 Tax=Thermodesulfobacterium hveragerdense TaxID=53424 RepID=UPI0003FFF2C5|nr:flagellar hook-length control protein FliK [Thermodesulfobacterium hveragerdense]